MKKFLAFALALVMVLSLSVTAFASGTGNDDSASDNTKDTSVTFNVAPTYTVTIPQKVELDKKTAENGTITYEKDLTISAENVRLLEGQKIKVQLTGCDFTLTAGNTNWPYTVTVGNESITAQNNVVATFETSTNKQSSTLHFAAGNPEFAGEYSDTVTFTISVA